MVAAEAQEEINRLCVAVKSGESLWTLEEHGPVQLRADQLASEISPEQWRRLSAGEGSKGSRLYEWALRPIYRPQLTEEERYWGHWLLVRRSLEDPQAPRALGGNRGIERPKEKRRLRHNNNESLWSKGGLPEP